MLNVRHLLLPNRTLCCSNVKIKRFSWHVPNFGLHRDLRGRGYALCELPFGLVVVHPVAGDGSQLPAPVVLIVDVVGDVLQVLHVSPGRGITDIRRADRQSRYSNNTEMIFGRLDIQYCTHTHDRIVVLRHMGHVRQTFQNTVNK